MTAFLLLLLAPPLLPAHAGGVAPWSSHERLVSANGHGAVVVDAGHGSGVVLGDFRDRLYQQADADSAPVRDLLYDAYFGLRVDGADAAWITGADAVTYRQGTGVVEITRSAGALVLTEHVFAPLSWGHPGYVHLLHVENTGSEARSVTAFSLHNHHVGGEGDDGIANHDEAIWVEGQALVEEGEATGLGMVVRALGTPDSHTCDQLCRRVLDEGALDGRCGSEGARWVSDDQVGGFSWDLGTLAPGADAWVGAVALFYDGGDSEAAVSTAEGMVSGRDAETLLTAETTAWGTWRTSATVPSGLSDDEFEVYEQALVFLKMGQVREDGAPHGQIPASLPVASSVGDFTHLWNITWVRDSAYGIRALSAAGFDDEADAALRFLLQGKAGDYAHLVGRDYALSVCRLYGDGSEWSDDDGTGPNVELDNFGLLLWALGEHVDASGDTTIVSDRSEVIFDGIADVLVDVVDDTGLVMADSSIWERHWDGNQQRFAYTQAWAVRGLREAADLADAVDDPRADTYRSTADAVRDAMCGQLLDADGVLAASLEQLADGSGYLDLAGVDAFNNGTFDAASREGRASLAAWTDGLAVASGHGLKRNDDGDLYDEQEWVWADLRVAQALRRSCDEDAARALEDWVTAQAIENHWSIPELMDPATAAYAGPVPMMGFGSGLYVLNLLGREDAAADCADGVAFECPVVGDSGSTDGGTDSGGGGGDGGSDDGGTDGGMDDGGGDADGGSDDGGGEDGGADTGAEPGKDCGCTAGGASPGLLALFLLPLVARRRR